jgi:calcium binding protein 39
LIPLLSNLSTVPFEAKKDIAACFNNLLRKSAPGDEKRYPFVEHVAANPAVIDMLFDGYDTADIALVCGSMLRECLRHESLAAAAFNSERVWLLFNYVEYANFDVSSDALATFRDLITTHRDLVANFLLQKFDRFFGAYRDLLRSPNYVTRRQTLKLLGEVIVHRRNFTVMNKFISSKLDLMIMMNLLRDKSKSIQYEAFHVFKVFVANPNKPDDIVQILRRNRERLTTFLTKFRTDIEDDQFVREKAYLLKAINEIK